MRWRVSLSRGSQYNVQNDQRLTGGIKMSGQIAKHIDYVNSVVRTDGPGGILACENKVWQSWIRCVRDYGLDPASRHDVQVIEHAQLNSRQERFSELVATAKVEMTNLYQQLAGSGFAVLLTDADGVVLNCVGDPDFTSKAAKTGILCGAIWSEKLQGTNGMGTCLIEQRPLVIHQAEHFLARNIGLTCSAAPILNPQGEMIAVLDASTHSHLAQQHTLVLVNMSAQTIENRLFLSQYRNSFVVRFHSRPEFVGTLGEGEIAVSETGRVLAANRSALFQLDFRTRDEVVDKGIHEVFSLSFSSLIEQSARSWTTPSPIHEARHGHRFFAVTQQPENMVAGNGFSGSAKRARVRPMQTRGYPTLQLDDLNLGDAKMVDNVRRAKRMLGCDIPFLIHGETGTGKELFAKAVHNADDGQHKPFVAVNCASLPESLIESELFGYKSGAFTGASREGRRGKILQANGGTLFLDEIGDMPLQLQARLLRVLEEREVSPLGSEASVRVDFRLISATHQSLEELIDKGEFRQDLYYRLQGISIFLPALRDRTDKRNLIRQILASESVEGKPAAIEEDALRLMEHYHWPGNIRQLRNVLRAGLALREGPSITVTELPEEITRASRCERVRPQEEEKSSSGAALNSLESAEKNALLTGLEKHRWKITNLARELNVSRNTLYRKMKRLNIRDPSK